MIGLSRSYHESEGYNDVDHLYFNSVLPEACHEFKELATGSRGTNLQSPSFSGKYQ